MFTQKVTEMAENYIKEVREIGHHRDIERSFFELIPRFSDIISIFFCRNQIIRSSQEHNHFLWRDVFSRGQLQWPCLSPVDFLLFAPARVTHEWSRLDCQSVQSSALNEINDISDHNYGKILSTYFYRCGYTPNCNNVVIEKSKKQKAK